MVVGVPGAPTGSVSTDVEVLPEVDAVFVVSTSEEPLEPTRKYGCGGGRPLEAVL
jgi:hypothetical protein